MFFVNFIIKSSKYIGDKGAIILGNAFGLLPK
jgi:hypothetical protein